MDKRHTGLMASLSMAVASVVLAWPPGLSAQRPNAATTVTSLAAGGTTCVNPDDLSGYWVPSLTVNGAAVQPTFANVYYQSAGKPFRNFPMILLRSIPITPPCGPVIPTSVI